MNLKFESNHLGLNVAACESEINKYADEMMTVCAEHLMRIMRKQIDINGNGSWFMRNTAISQVKEILHEVSDGLISIEAGIDEGALKGAAEAVYVRTMVVLHGNQAGGPLMTKPGQDTYGKHVVAKGPSGATTAYKLPDSWNMFDVSGGIMDNTMNEVHKYFKDMLNAILEHALEVIANNITVG